MVASFSGARISIVAVGVGVGDASGISDAGGVTINAGNINLGGGGIISTSAVAADAGMITITADDLSLDESGITTSAGFDGGSMELHISGLVYLLDSTIRSEAKGGIGTRGGDIQIDPQFVILDNSRISANDLNGTGGNITIITDDFLNENTSITSTGATNGTITISEPDLNLSGSLLARPVILVDEQNRLRESCARSVNHEFSSLVVVGRGGTEASPDELQPDFDVENATPPVNP